MESMKIAFAQGIKILMLFLLNEMFHLGQTSKLLLNLYLPPFK